MDLIEKKLSSEKIYAGKVFSVERDRVLLPDGAEAVREVARHPGGVCVAAVDANRDVYLVEQYRYPLGFVTLELPAGKLDPGERPLAAALRELREETGLVAERMRCVGEYYATPGFCDELLTLYVADSLVGASQQLDEGEFLNVKKMPLGEAVGMVLDNRIRDGKTKTLLLLADRVFPPPEAE